MNIYTSYFDRVRHFDKDSYMAVSISRFPPKWFHGVKCFAFAPSVRLLRSYKSGLSKADYVMRYRSECLDRCDVREVFVRLAKLANGRDIVLMCFEPMGAFCHRHVLSDYVFEKYGYRIKEFVL